MQLLRILLVDDSSEFLESAARFLTSHHHILVVGRASSGYEALEQVAALVPDLVLMDVTMPGMNGLEATRQIKSQAGAPRIVLMTLHDLAEYRIAAKSAAADGFIAKTSIRSQLLPLLEGMFAEPPTDGVVIGQ
jgi:DNA-binding NarL/FixJ family response regulator